MPKIKIKKVEKMIDDRFIRMPEVIKMTGLGKSTIFAWINTNRFPAPIKMGRRVSVWKISTIHAWMEDNEKSS